MINRFVLNVCLISDRARGSVAKQEINRLGLYKAFVSTDKDLLKLVLLTRYWRYWRRQAFHNEISQWNQTESYRRQCESGREAFAKSGADFILAIGGGSSIDTSKAIGIITNNPEFSDVVSLEGVAPTKRSRFLSLWPPTTAGTAAEVTINRVITDEENHKRRYALTPMISRHAIVDAELMYTPKRIGSFTGTGCSDSRHRRLDN